MKLKTILVTLTSALLVGCASAPTATPTVAPPVTVTTAPSPTLMPTPTDTPTPTAMPTPTPPVPATPTITPTPDFSGAVLTVDDLPSGFQPASPADMARLNISEASVAEGFSSLRDGHPRNLVVFLRAAPSYEQVMSVLIYPLSPSDAALIDAVIANPDSLIQAVGARVSSGGSGTIRSSTTIPGADRFGDYSLGVSLGSSGSTVPLRWDVLLARRRAFAELIYLVYIDGRQPSITVSDLARILDGRLAAALGGK